MLELVDLDITVHGGGASGQAGAIRYALSMCLRSFVEKSVVDDMKINGLLTQVKVYCNCFFYIGYITY